MPCSSLVLVRLGPCCSGLRLLAFICLPLYSGMPPPSSLCRTTHRCTVHVSAAFPAVLFFRCPLSSVMFALVYFTLALLFAPFFANMRYSNPGCFSVFFSYRYVAAGPALIKAALIALSAQSLDGIAFPFSASPRSAVAWWARLRVARRRADKPHCWYVLRALGQLCAAFALVCSRSSRPRGVSLFYAFLFCFAFLC